MHRTRSTVACAVVGLSSLVACAGERPLTNGPVPRPATLEVAPMPSARPYASTSSSPAPAPAALSTARGSSTSAPSACTDSLPPRDLVRDNIASTAMTGLGEIVRSAKTSLDGKSPPPTTGYVSLRYEVRVLRWFSGGAASADAGTGHLSLSQGAEAEATPAAPGRLLFFSACARPDGTGWEPDVGYFFPVDAACRPEVEAFGDAAAKGARASAKRPGACTH